MDSKHSGEFTVAPKSSDSQWYPLRADTEMHTYTQIKTKTNHWWGRGNLFNSFYVSYRVGGGTKSGMGETAPFLQRGSGVVSSKASLPNT